MANLVFNIALGRVVELYNRVDTSDPSTARLRIIAILTSGTDADLRDRDTLSGLLAISGTMEVTNSGYARKTLAAADLTAFAPDDVNDRVDLDIPDQTWTAIVAGTAWTDLIIGYDPGNVSPNDDGIVPLTLHDFAVTPDGSDITAQVAAAGFFRASPA